MKILIVSDTHRRDGNLQTVIEKTAPFDMLIHLGDAEGSEDRIETWCREQNENCQVHMILGNNDFFSNLEREKEISIGDYRAFLTHGHFYSVSVGTERLADEARDRKAQIATVSYTHQMCIRDRHRESASARHRCSREILFSTEMEKGLTMWLFT